MRTPALILATVIVGAAAVPPGLTAQQPADAAQHEQHHPGATVPPAAAAEAAQAATTPQMRGPMMQRDMKDMSEMMARMHANDAKIDQLVKKMQSATGAAKTDAIAELLTTLVEERRTVHGPMMSHMMSMMGNMPGARGTQPGTSTTPSR
jgi:hypothetical protein